MEKLEGSIKKVVKILNGLAGWGIAAAMLLTVFNIILRAVFKKPVLGTYEYTGFLAAAIVGLSIAYCAVLDGHIALDFIIEKFNIRVRNIIDAVTRILFFCFMSFFTCRIFIYASQVAASGQVSPTTRTPFYLFIYVIAIGFAALSLVLLFKIRQAIKGVMKNES